MTLTVELDKRICDRFEELLKRAQDLEGEVASVSIVFHDQFISRHEALLVSTQNIIRMAFADSKIGKEHQDSVKNMRGKRNFENSVKRLIGILTSLLEDYKHGYINDVEEWIIANVSSDYMGQAEGLLDEATPGQYDYVPAAVLCGAVLEDALRRLCNRQTPKIAIVKRNGKPKTLDPLITDLKSAGAFKGTKAAELRSWAQIRNAAAHARFNDFDRHQVESMITGVKQFLADYM